MDDNKSEELRRAEVRARGFLKAAVKTVTFQKNEKPQIGLLTEALMEVFGDMGFKIIPPTHYYSQPTPKK